MSKKIIMTVTNDLVSDQRVKKVANSLYQMGFDILLIGRQMRKSPPMDIRPYTVKRFKLLFEKGKLFYAEYNIRLFLYLLFHRFDIAHANDLDTLLPCTLVCQLKNKKLIYDSHEYFTEVAELVNRPNIQKIWKKIERYCFPKTLHTFTVCQPIADLYQNEYHKQVLVMRNIPPQRIYSIKKSRKDLQLPEDKAILIVQGSGINIQRGVEELVEAMQYVQNAILLIIGNGDVVPQLKQMSRLQHTEDKILFYDRMNYEDLFNYTVLADIGFSLDKNISINHLYALPNKLFDFIRARVPIVASPMQEVAKIIREYQIGCVLKEVSVEEIANTVNHLLSHREELAIMKSNLEKASNDLCWENEEKILQSVYQQLK